MKKRSVNILGHATSVTLEEEFWTALKEIAQTQGKSINLMIAEIDKNRSGNLSSAIRVFILQELQTQNATQ